MFFQVYVVCSWRDFWKSVSVDLVFSTWWTAWERILRPANMLTHLQCKSFKLQSGAFKDSHDKCVMWCDVLCCGRLVNWISWHLVLQACMNLLYTQISHIFHLGWLWMPVLVCYTSFRLYSFGWIQFVENILHK